MRLSDNGVRPKFRNLVNYTGRKGRAGGDGRKIKNNLEDLYENRRDRMTFENKRHFITDPIVWCHRFAKWKTSKRKRARPSYINRIRYCYAVRSWRINQKKKNKNYKLPTASTVWAIVRKAVKNRSVLTSTINDRQEIILYV